MAMLFTVLLTVSAAILGYFLIDFSRRDFLRETEAAINIEINMISSFEDAKSQLLPYIQRRAKDDEVVRFRLEDENGHLLGGSIDPMPKDIRAAFGRIDRIIYLAAAYAPMKIDKLDLAITKGVIDVNLTGAFSIVHAATTILKTQTFKGQIALCGSVAGYMGLPGGQPYSATKAAIINLAESLYAEYSKIIDVKLISPGFVRTPLTDKNNFKMPMIIEPERAAQEIADGLLSRRFEIDFPKKFTIILKILRVLPYAISLRLIRNIKA